MAADSNGSNYQLFGCLIIELSQSHRVELDSRPREGKRKKHGGQLRGRRTQEEIKCHQLSLMISPVVPLSITGADLPGMLATFPIRLELD